eukprot:7276286-Prymnesium_polylepis.1
MTNERATVFYACDRNAHCDAGVGRPAHDAAVRHRQPSPPRASEPCAATTTPRTTPPTTTLSAFPALHRQCH